MKVSLRRAEPIVRKLVAVTLENISELDSTDYTDALGNVREKETRRQTTSVVRPQVRRLISGEPWQGVSLPRYLCKTNTELI